MTPAIDTSSWCFRHLVTVENVPDPAQGFPLRFAVLMGVDLQRNGQPGMAKDQLGVTGGTFRFFSKVAVVCLRWCTLICRRP
jgi:hypothetical protein